MDRDWEESLWSSAEQDQVSQVAGLEVDTVREGGQDGREEVVHVGQAQLG